MYARRDDSPEKQKVRQLVSIRTVLRYFVSANIHATINFISLIPGFSLVNAQVLFSTCEQRPHVLASNDFHLA